MDICAGGSLHVGDCVRAVAGGLHCGRDVDVALIRASRSCQEARPGRVLGDVGTRTGTFSLTDRRVGNGGRVGRRPGTVVTVLTGVAPMLVLPPHAKAAKRTEPPVGMLTVALEESNVEPSLSTST